MYLNNPVGESTITHSRHRHQKCAKDENAPECNYFMFKERTRTVQCKSVNKTKPKWNIWLDSARN